MYKRLKKVLSFFAASMMLISVTPTIKAKADTNIAGNGRLLVGYWHNFDNGAGIVKIKDVDPVLGCNKRFFWRNLH